MPRKAPTHKPPGWKPRPAWVKQAPPRKLTGRPWRRKREAVLSRDRYLCQQCERAGRVTVATEVDHIVSIAANGSDDDENLEAICAECHKAKTAREAAAGMRRG